MCHLIFGVCVEHTKSSINFLTMKHYMLSPFYPLSLSSDSNENCETQNKYNRDFISLVNHTIVYAEP